MPESKGSAQADVPTVDIRDLIGGLDDGALYVQLNDDLEDIARALRKHVGDQGGNPKATLTITLTFQTDGKLMEIKPKVAKNLPTPERNKGVYWITKDNRLSPQNPQQLELGVVKDASTAPPRPQLAQV